MKMGLGTSKVLDFFLEVLDETAQDAAHRWHLHSCRAGRQAFRLKLLARSHPQPSIWLQGPGTRPPLVI